MSSGRLFSLCSRLYITTPSRAGRQVAVRSTDPQTIVAAAWSLAQPPSATGQAASFASGSGSSLRHSPDQELQGAEGGHPGPDDTNVGQKSPLAHDEKGEPQVGKVSTADGSDESDPKVAPVDIEQEDVIPNVVPSKD